MERGGAVADELSWLELSCLGETLPAAAENRLQMAARNYANAEEAEQYLHQALTLAPRHPAVYIAFYRFHFYHSRVRQALPYAELCLGLAARELKLSPDWRKVKPEDARFQDISAYGPRFYLFSLKALGYLKMRMGDLEQGRQAVEKVRQLDPDDRVGASVLLQVLERQEQDEDE